jgi:hypothetical protein
MKKEKDNKVSIDKHSHSHLKNMLFLKRYKEKLKENNLYIFKNLIIFLYNKEKRVDSFMRRRVIIQNITLLKAREK